MVSLESEEDGGSRSREDQCVRSPEVREKEKKEGEAEEGVRLLGIWYSRRVGTSDGIVSDILNSMTEYQRSEKSGEVYRLRHKKGFGLD